MLFWLAPQTVHADGTVLHPDGTYGYGTGSYLRPDGSYGSTTDYQLAPDGTFIDK